MGSHDTGYQDELFQHPVGHTLHCGICLNVLKDPVSCQHNEHLFCRACITVHLMNFQTCPSCMEPLTVQSLSQAPRAVTSLLSELKIRCEFFERGCGQFVELQNLERHVTDCGFAPAICSNEGCQLVVNRKDLLHHETAVCEQRRVKCHSCDEIKQEMNTVKGELAEMKGELTAVNGKLKGAGERMDKNENNIETIKTEMTNVAAKVEQIQVQLKNQEESNRRLEADNLEVKRNLNEIMKQLERIAQQTPHKVQSEQMKKNIAEGGMVREPKVVIAGGWGQNSVEMFCLINKTWTLLQPMKECRGCASSVVDNNHIFVHGGYNKSEVMKSIQKLSLNAVHIDQTASWEQILAELPGNLCGHGSVVYNGRLIIIGGYKWNFDAISDTITEMSVVPPYIHKLLATMPQTRLLHGVALFCDKILILGGEVSSNAQQNLASILLYDITMNECKELAPLPYPVSQMATVKWGDDSVILAGGRDSNRQTLNKVLLYNIKTQKSHMLPDMKYNRSGCVAAVVKDTVIVMGGKDGRKDDLKSVECFRFDRYTWEELPEMHEARFWATAVVC